MNTKKTSALAAALVIVAAAAYWAGVRHGTSASPAAAPGNPPASDKIDPSNGKKVLYWHDPMVPGPKFDKPGKSPFMDMQLVPVYADDAATTGGATISPRVQQNLGIRTAEVREGVLAGGVEAVGNIAYNERDVVLVQARAAGIVERLYVRAPQERVRRGQPLAALYVPDWVAAQEEYLAARRMSPDLADGARQRMRLAGMDEEQVRQVERSGKVAPRVTLTAPAAGVVSELAVREGASVMAGAPVARINGTATVWVNAEIPESAAPQVRAGNPVQARSAAWPGVTFKGTVGALLPEVNPATRTLTARIELANPDGRLAPGMFANVSLTQRGRPPALLVPSEAVIQTGTRSVVFVAGDAGTDAGTDGGTFTAVDVVTGAESGGQTEILRGLKAGQKVVASGQFLVDSEASLKSSGERMDSGAGGTK